ncbi:hypothetical protein [Actinomadura yumaensis]|uniref:Uncharacterized protein n=1 Tax=Actinomadura yumaensis TaxID=111807 RepID=A0ABW2CDU2_9ACTN
MSSPRLPEDALASLPEDAAPDRIPGPDAGARAAAPAGAAVSRAADGTGAP